MRYFLVHGIISQWSRLYQQSQNDHSVSYIELKPTEEPQCMRSIFHRHVFCTSTLQLLLT